MRSPIHGMMTTTVPTMRAALLAVFTASGASHAAAHPTAVDTASFIDGGLRNAIAPKIASVLADTLTGVLETIGYGYAVFLGLALAAVLCRVCRELMQTWEDRQDRVAEQALRRHAGAGR